MDRRLALELVVASVFFSLLGKSLQEGGVQCGRPGRPVNGTISPAGSAYYPGEKVTYSCLEGFVLFGEEGRTCFKNGTWSGDVPLCDFNLAKGKRSLQSATLWSYSPDLAVDGNSDTCSFTPRGPEPRWWQVHLGHKYNVVSIGVTISPGSFQEFTIFVIELLADNKALYKPCTTFKGVFQTQKGLFKCNDGLGHPGQFVYLRDDREEEEYFGLCEVEVFAFREKTPCGEPEIPVAGEVKRQGQDIASYSCSAGFRLEGDQVLTCSSKGKWQGHPPRCHEMKCPAPPTISNGFFEASASASLQRATTAQHVYGTEIHYSCSNGYFMEGGSTLVCGDKGIWSGVPPICKSVTCGQPPSFPNAKHLLLTDSNQWSKIAVYSCLEGYKLLEDSEDAVTTCQDNGTWRYLNITCIPTEMAKFFQERQGQGRSLIYEEFPDPNSLQPMPNLVIALATIAGLLTIVMLIVGVIFLRKRLLAGPGSLSPLVTTPEKVNSDLHVIGGFHHQRPNNGTIPGYIDGLGRPTHFQTNLLQNIAQKDYRNQLNHSDKFSDDGVSVGTNEPPYEKVKSRSEHSYETLKKKKSSYVQNDTQEYSDPHYEVAGNDKESVGYEPIMTAKEPCYEIASYRDANYEVMKEKTHDYETVKDRKDVGYETIKSSDQEPGYEVVEEERKSIHGYETLKPKLPPRESTPDEVVPDILQHLYDNDDDSESLEVKSSAKPAAAEVPLEILALYAKVDKSKKNKSQAKNNSTSNQKLNGSKDDGRGGLVQRKIPKLPNNAKDIIKKFNSFPPEESSHRSLSPQASITSECSVSSSGAARPLPPIPR